jgi:ribosomal protein S12 methylthiotransferase accessory factor
MRIVQRLRSNPMNGMVEEIEMEIQVPPSFPEKYYDALVRSAEQCAVKKHLEKPPHFNIHTVAVN